MNDKKRQQTTRIQQQNKIMQKFIDQYMQQIQHLKNLNKQHQNQIQSLLKFNQRLLTIIQQEITNNQSRHAQKSLQPISQVTQVDSQLMDQMMQSLQKTRKKLAARSQKGNPYLSNIQTKYPSNNINLSNNRMDNKLFIQQTKDLQRSQRFPSMDKQFSDLGNKSSFSKKRQKKYNAKNVGGFVEEKEMSLDEYQLNQNNQRTTSVSDLVGVAVDKKDNFMLNKKKNIGGLPGFHQYQYEQPNLPTTNNLKSNSKKKLEFQQQQTHKKPDQKYYKMSQQISSKIGQQMEKFRKQSQMNNAFLQQKIDKLKNLSQKIVYDPQSKFKQLQTKIKMSPNTAALVKKAMLKGK